MKISYSQKFGSYTVSDLNGTFHKLPSLDDAMRVAGIEPANEEDFTGEDESLSDFIVRSWEEGYEKSEILMGVERDYGAEHCELAEQIVDKLQVQFSQREAQEKTMPTLEALAEVYGHRLEILTAVEKLDVISVLSIWQAMDTNAQESGEESVEIEEAIEGFPGDLSGDTRQVLLAAEGLPGDQILDLIITISQQLKDGVFAQ